MPASLLSDAQHDPLIRYENTSMPALRLTIDQACWAASSHTNAGEDDRLPVIVATLI